MPIRRLAVLALLLPLCAGAQPPRLTIEPLAGWWGGTDLYRHDVTYPAVGGFGAVRSSERLRLDGGALLGARLAARVVGAWSVHLEGATRQSAHALTTRSSGGVDLVTGRELGSWAAWSGPASARALLVGVSRPIVATRRGTALGAEVGATWVRAELRLLRRPVLAPSAGFSVPSLGRYEAVQPRYDVRGAQGGLHVTQAIGRRVAVRARVGAAAGRVNTQSFVVKFRPPADAYEAPARYTMRAVDASLGLQLRLR